MQAVGIDGCRAGWLVVLVDDEQIQMQLCPSIQEAADYCQDAKLIWIDMPIGFIDVGPEGRECDRLARRLLSPIRHSSVFTPPCRSALYASLDQSSEVNFQHTGKKLSRQLINIIPKMRELDAYLQQLDRVQAAKWHEAHPEILFAQFNEGHPIPTKKKQAEGQAARLRLLSNLWPEIPAWFQENQHRYPRKAVQLDDIIDALGLAIGAWSVQQGRFIQKSLPDTPPRDHQGLAMQIVYPQDPTL